MARYKWSTPHQWLLEAAQSWDSAQLYSALSSIIDKLDGDTIQDLYQSDMTEDGYFRDLDHAAPVIYILNDEDEAEDVLYFCSSTCRNLYETTDTDICDLAHKDGSSTDFIDGTVCEHCGKLVEDGESVSQEAN